MSYLSVCLMALAMPILVGAILGSTLPVVMDYCIAKTVRVCRHALLMAGQNTLAPSKDAELAPTVLHAGVGVLPRRVVLLQFHAFHVATHSELGTFSIHRQGSLMGQAMQSVLGNVRMAISSATRSWFCVCTRHRGV